jgi:hypothetical protein
MLPLLALVCACGGASSERSLDDFLAVGVDLRTECDRVRDSLADAGLEVVSRVDLPFYCALSAASADGLRTAVRVVTTRGIVYSADGAVDGLPGETPVSLLAPPGGHAGSELLVARAASELAGRCIEVVQLDATGGARSIPLELEALAAVVPVDERTCIGDVLDLDGNGIAEAYVRVHAPLPPAPHARASEVRVPLAPGPGGFVYVAPPGAYWQTERRARAELLAVALAARDFATADALGVELALIARLAGESASAQLAAYDASIAGLSIGTEQQTRIDAAHAAFGGE